MKKEEVVSWLNGCTDDYDYSNHRLLVNLTCVFEDDYGEIEVTFAVPTEWILQTLQQYPQWSWSDLHKWLENEYTSEDSQYILEKAVEENQLAFWIIN